MSLTTPDRPTRARYVLVLWLCGLSSLLYLDRICMSQAVKPISAELGLSKVEMSYALMAFTMAYGLCAVPAGRMGDTRGPRVMLASLVGAWSVFTAATGLATGLLGLVVVRFLFGAAEAGALPNTARVMTRWYPLGERGRIQGLLLAFAQVGAIIAPVASAVLIEWAGWRAVFGLYAVVGLVWALGFWVWFRDDPASHRGVNEAELVEIRSAEAGPPAAPGPVPWAAILTNRGVISLSAVMVLGAFFTYFFYSWFPTYLMDARGVGNREAGMLNSLAIGGSAVGMLLGGWLSDRVTRQAADPARGRRYVSMTGFLVAAVCMYAGTRCESAWALAGLWSAAMCAMHVQLPNWWSAIIPLAGRHTATVFALANGVGVIGAMASQAFAAQFADYQERTLGLTGRAAWDPMFDVYVLALVGGAFAWWTYRHTPLPEAGTTAEGQVQEDEGW